MSSNLKVNSLVPATGTEIGIGTTGGTIDFRCPATFGGNVTIGGTLTYDEVINIDSIGIVTARSGIKALSGGADIIGQTTISHTGSPQLILKDSDSNSPNDANGISLRAANNTEYGFIGQSDTGGHVLFIKTVATTNPIRLQVNSTTRLEVGNTGCFVTGVLDVASGGTSSLRGDVYIPDKLRHIGDDDTSIRFPADDTVSVETAGDERFKIESTGRTFIKTDESTTGLIVQNTVHDSQLRIEASAANKNSIIQFADGADGDVGMIDYDHNDNSLAFTVNTGERLRIDSTGILKLYGDNGNNSLIYGHRAGSLTYILGNQSGSNDFNIKTWASSTNIIFSIAGNNEKVRISSGGRVGINTSSPTHNLHVYGTDNTSGARFNIDHTTTTVSGNTASGAFPHNILLSNYANNQPNNMATIGFDIPATTGSGSHANAVIVGQAENGNGNCSLQFWTESGNSIGERLRITSTGQLQATGAADVRLTLGSSGTAGTNNSVHVRADSADLKFMAASGGSTLFETNGEEQFKLEGSGTRVCRRGVNFPNPNNTGSEITAAVFKLGSDNIQIQEKYPNGAYSDRCDIVIRTNSGYGGGQSDKLRLTAGGNIYLAGRQYLTRSGVAPLGNAGNLRETFFQAIAVGANHTFQVSNSYAGGLVYVAGSRHANANIQTTKIYAIAIRTTANAHITSISSVNGQSGSFSFTVTGGSKGITVTNNDSTYSCNCFVTFDITGFVA